MKALKRTYVKLLESHKKKREQKENKLQRLKLRQNILKKSDN
jgi:hypothetical protein